MKNRVQNDANYDRKLKCESYSFVVRLWCYVVLLRCSQCFSMLSTRTIIVSSALIITFTFSEPPVSSIIKLIIFQCTLANPQQLIRFISGLALDIGFEAQTCFNWQCIRFCEYIVHFGHHVVL